MYTMATDVLMTEGAKASASTAVVWFAWIIQISEPGGRLNIKVSSY